MAEQSMTPVIKTSSSPPLVQAPQDSSNLDQPPTIAQPTTTSNPTSSCTPIDPSIQSDSIPVQAPSVPRPPTSTIFAPSSSKPAIVCFSNPFATLIKNAADGDESAEDEDWSDEEQSDDNKDDAEEPTIDPRSTSLGGHKVEEDPWVETDCSIDGRDGEDSGKQAPTKRVLLQSSLFSTFKVRQILMAQTKQGKGMGHEAHQSFDRGGKGPDCEKCPKKHWVCESEKQRLYDDVLRVRKINKGLSQLVDRLQIARGSEPQSYVGTRQHDLNVEKILAAKGIAEKETRQVQKVLNGEKKRSAKLETTVASLEEQLRKERESHEEQMRKEVERHKEQLSKERGSHEEQLRREKESHEALLVSYRQKLEVYEPRCPCGPEYGTTIEYLNLDHDGHDRFTGKQHLPSCFGCNLPTEPKAESESVLKLKSNYFISFILAAIIFFIYSIVSLFGCDKSFRSWTGMMVNDLKISRGSREERLLLKI